MNIDVSYLVDTNAKIPAGDVAFVALDGSEILKISSTGEVRVRGELVDNNRNVYLAFREWLGMHSPKEFGLSE